MLFVIIWIIWITCVVIKASTNITNYACPNRTPASWMSTSLSNINIYRCFHGKLFHGKRACEPSCGKVRIAFHCNVFFWLGHLDCILWVMVGPARPSDRLENWRPMNVSGPCEVWSGKVIEKITGFAGESCTKKTESVWKSGWVSLLLSKRAAASKTQIHKMWSI